MNRGLSQPGANCRSCLREALAAMPFDREPRAGGLPAGGLSEETQAHLQSCTFCAQRLAAGQRLGEALKTRPASPAELFSPAMLDRVRERIVAQGEASEFGQTLARAMPVAEVPAAGADELSDAGAGWSGGLLESAVGKHVAFVGPVETGPLLWRRVQVSIYGRVLADSASRRRLWPLGAAGAAAAAIFLLMLLRQGTIRTPEIVFTDLASAPNVDFAILRYGAPR